MILVLSGQAADANDAPLLFPARSVAVLYRLTGTSQMQGAQKLRVTYGSENRVRMDFYRDVEAMEPFGSLIYDPPADRVTTLLPERRGYVQRDIGNLPSPGAFLNAKMSFAGLGKATVAGMPCTDWRVTNGSTSGGSVCVTDDGVVLRATREQPAKGEIQALQVTYGPTPADLFVPPAGFKFIPSPEFPQIKPPTQ
jgi:hypothetical protein